MFKAFVVYVTSLQSVFRFRVRSAHQYFTLAALFLCAAGSAHAQLTGLKIQSIQSSTDATGVIQTFAITFNHPIDPTSANHGAIVLYRPGSLEPQGRLAGAVIQVKGNLVSYSAPYSTACNVLRITTGLKSLAATGGLRQSLPQHVDLARQPGSGSTFKVYTLAARGAAGAAAATERRDFALAARSASAQGKGMGTDVGGQAVKAAAPLGDSAVAAQVHIPQGFTYAIAASANEARKPWRGYDLGAGAAAAAFDMAMHNPRGAGDRVQ